MTKIIVGTNRNGIYETLLLTEIDPGLMKRILHKQKLKWWNQYCRNRSCSDEIIFMK